MVHASGNRKTLSWELHPRWCGWNHRKVLLRQPVTPLGSPIPLHKLPGSVTRQSRFLNKLHILSRGSNNPVLEALMVSWVTTALFLALPRHISPKEQLNGVPTWPHSTNASSLLPCSKSLLCGSPAASSSLSVAQRPHCPTPWIVQWPAWFILRRKKDNIPRSSGSVTDVMSSFCL